MVKSTPLFFLLFRLLQLLDYLLMPRLLVQLTVKIVQLHIYSLSIQSSKAKLLLVNKQICQDNISINQHIKLFTTKLSSYPVESIPCFTTHAAFIVKTLVDNVCLLKIMFNIYIEDCIHNAQQCFQQNTLTRTAKPNKHGIQLLMAVQTLLSYLCTAMKNFHGASRAHKCGHFHAHFFQIVRPGTGFTVGITAFRISRFLPVIKFYNSNMLQYKTHRRVKNNTEMILLYYQSTQQ